jgi:hypothetical protein
MHQLLKPLARIRWAVVVWRRVYSCGTTLVGGIVGCTALGSSRWVSRVCFLLDHPLANHTVRKVRRNVHLLRQAFAFYRGFPKAPGGVFQRLSSIGLQPSTPHTLPQRHSCQCCAGTVPHGIPLTSCLGVHASPCGVGMLLDHLLMQ